MEEEPNHAIRPRCPRLALTLSADAFNRSSLHSVLAVVLTSNFSLVAAPGNVLIPAQVSGLPKDSVANVTQVITLDRDFLRDPAEKLPPKLLHQVDAGLRLALALQDLGHTHRFKGEEQATLLFSRIHPIIVRDILLAGLTRGENGTRSAHVLGENTEASLCPVGERMCLPGLRQTHGQ